MSNFVGDIHMSNGLTDVFLNVLVLSGSTLARTAEEKQQILWLAERDQSKVGMGMVGFDLCDLPWDLDTAEADASDPVRCGFPLCPKHQTLLTVFGCQICNQ